jgi:hypothetical protein
MTASTPPSQTPGRGGGTGIRSEERAFIQNGCGFLLGVSYQLPVA